MDLKWSDHMYSNPPEIPPDPCQFGPGSPDRKPRASLCVSCAKFPRPCRTDTLPPRGAGIQRSQVHLIQVERRSIMEIAVISDLHLGTGGAADGFGHDDGEFLKFLTFLEKNL